MKTKSSPSTFYGEHRDIAHRCVHLSELVAALARLPDSTPTNVVGYEVCTPDYIQLRFELKPVPDTEPEFDEDEPVVRRALGARAWVPGFMNARELRTALADPSMRYVSTTNVGGILPVSDAVWLTYLKEVVDGRHAEAPHWEDARDSWRQETAGNAPALQPAFPRPAMCAPRLDRVAGKAPLTKAPLLPEYRIEGGNSSTGDIGFVAYVRAPDAEAALARLKKVSVSGNHNAITVKNGGDYELCIYINMRWLRASLIVPSFVL